MFKAGKILIMTLTSAIVMSLVKGESNIGLRYLNETEYYADEVYDKLLYVRNINCTNVNCPLPHACLDANTCRCANGFANYYDPITDDQVQARLGPYCIYERKKQLTAFLLQFFVFCGAGQFYVGNIQYAVPQLIISLAPCIISCIQCIMGIRIKGEDRPCGHLVILIINCLFSCALCGWWLADVIIFGMNKHLDGNGVPLNPW
jgi:hypothetical protein